MKKETTQKVLFYIVLILCTILGVTVIKSTFLDVMFVFLCFMAGLIKYEMDNAIEMPDDFDDNLCF